MDYKVAKLLNFIIDGIIRMALSYKYNSTFYSRHLYILSILYIFVVKTK